MQQGNGAMGHCEVYRHAVGDGDGHEDPGRGAHPSINALNLNPAFSGSDSADLRPVHLVAEDDGAEFRHRSAEGEPPVHHLADGLPAPQPQVEPPAGFAPTPRDPSYHAIPLPPVRYLKSRNRSWD